MLARFGKWGIVVNNAGTFPAYPFDDFSFDAWRKVISANLESQFLVRQAFVSSKKARGWGHTVNMTSGAAQLSSEKGAAYKASKMGATGLTRGMGANLGEYRITVRMPPFRRSHGPQAFCGSMARPIGSMRWPMRRRSNGYCRGLDRIDMSLVRGAFHKDAYIHFPESLHVGGAEGFFQFLTDEMPRFERTMHFLGNSLVEFDGPEIAYVETYLQADHAASARHHWKGDSVKLWARYFDRFERRDGVWLIAERRLMVDLMYRYPRGNWFDDHPDASGSPRDGTDRVLRKVAGYSGTPIASKSLANA